MITSCTWEQPRSGRFPIQRLTVAAEPPTNLYIYPYVHLFFRDTSRPLLTHSMATVAYLAGAESAAEGATAAQLISRVATVRVLEHALSLLDKERLGHAGAERAVVRRSA